MTPNRIAELRRMAYGCMGGRMYPQPIMDELLDALEAALERAEGAEAKVCDLEALCKRATGEVDIYREWEANARMEGDDNIRFDELIHLRALDALREQNEPSPEPRMIAQTYCGRLVQAPGSAGRICSQEHGPCPSCLREHIARLEVRNAELEDRSQGIERVEGGGAVYFQPYVDRLAERIQELEARAAAKPAPLESLIHDLAMAAWDCGADAGDTWCRDADRSKHGIVPVTPDEGFADSRRHFAEHGAGSPVAPFSVALEALRAGIAQAAAQAGNWTAGLLETLECIRDKCGREPCNDDQQTEWMRSVLDIIDRAFKAYHASRAAIAPQAASRDGDVAVPEPETSTLASLGAYSNPIDAVRATLRWVRENARALPASRVLGEGCVAVSEEELVALRCLDDAVTISGDGMSVEALGVDWKVARSAKKRLAALRAAKGGR